MMTLTAPRFRKHHSDIIVIDLQCCTKFKPNITSPNNHSLPTLLCLDSCNQLVSIINFP